MSASKSRLLADHADALELCTYCPKLCRHACPVGNATGRETLTPQSKMQLLNMLRREAIPWLGDHAETAHACTGCRLCQQYCRHGNDVAATLRDGRALAMQRGLEHPALGRLPERFRARNERLRIKLQQHLPPDRLAEEAQVGFFPGCDTIDASITDIDAAFAVFDALGLDFIRAIDGPLVCAGYPLWAAGHDDTAMYIAEELIAQLARFSTVVVGCPACLYLLRDKLPAAGIEVPTEVVHTTEFLFLHAERLDIRQRRPTATYHDPCFLGRYLEIYQPPRRLVERCVASPREFFHSRELAACCGGGSLVSHTFPEAASRQARSRLDEAALYDSKLVVTACPTCQRTFAGAAPGGVEVMDVVQLVAWALRGGE